MRWSAWASKLSLRPVQHHVAAGLARGGIPSDVPPYAVAEPDAIINHLADLRPLIEFWSAQQQS